MAKFEYIRPFGQFKPGDVVDVPDGAEVSAVYLKPAGESPAVQKDDEKIAELKAELAEAEAEAKKDDA